MTISPAAAQDIILNYERLSSLEEPLATQVGDVTFLLNGLLDASLTVDSQDNDAPGTGFIGNVEIGARTQLPNRWRVGLAYFGQYATEQTSMSGLDEGYTDNAALSVGGAWGTVLGGNVAGFVHEQTRRHRGAGNASLVFDDIFGGLEDWGGGYVVRLGPWVISAVIDEAANFDLGAMFQRPSGNKDYRLTTRYTESVYTASDGLSRFNAKAVSGVVELIYGSTLFDVGAAYERFSSGSLTIDRWYLSSGIHTKAGVLSVSLEGHYGQIEAEDEISVALGLQYDLARGLSANLGLNHAESRVILGGLSFTDTEESKAVFSLRYSF